MDHQYTQRNLSWKHLKGADRTRALALRQAAGLLEAECAMALAEIHEIWSVEYDIDPFLEARYRRSSRQSEASEMQLQDLLDNEIELRHWCGYESAPPQPAISRVANHEMCFVRPTVDFDPFETEYEGYMGNYGDTMDRWYHRAALVLWPKDRRFIMQARQDPIWGMHEIDRLLQSGRYEQALDQLKKLMPHWRVRNLQDHDLEKELSALLPMAIRLQDPSLAQAVLQPFRLEHLKLEAIADFYILAATYGPDWSQACLKQWQSTRYGFSHFHQWVEKVLPALAHAACADSTPLAISVAQDCWKWLEHELMEIMHTASLKQRDPMLRKLAPSLLALLKATRVLSANGLEQDITTSVLARGYPLDFVLSLLRHASGTAAWQSLSPLREHCIQQLADTLQAPPRQANDWSIAIPCGLPTVAGQAFKDFLCSSAQQKLTWPLAKAGRQDMLAWISHHDLPIRSSVINTGSPHKLVLQKTNALFTNAAKQHKAMTQAMAWLKTR